MIIGFVIGGEIAFWVLLLAGLVARYVLRMRRTSSVLLIATPFVDLVLLTAAAIDLRNGSEPSAAHGLAAAYLGFSVAFGPSLIRWTDAHFAHRFAGGQKPAKPPASGSWGRVRYEWVQWLRMFAAAAISSVLLLIAIWYVGDNASTDQLWQWMGLLGVITGIWLVVAPVWETAKASATPGARQS